MYSSVNTKNKKRPSTAALFTEELGNLGAKTGVLFFPEGVATLPEAIMQRRGGRVVMQRPAKPWTPVRFRPPPPLIQRVILKAQCRHVAYARYKPPVATLMGGSATRNIVGFAVDASLEATWLPSVIVVRLGNL